MAGLSLLTARGGRVRGLANALPHAAELLADLHTDAHTYCTPTKASTRARKPTSPLLRRLVVTTTCKAMIEGDLGVRDGGGTVHVLE